MKRGTGGNQKSHVRVIAYTMFFQNGTFLASMRTKDLSFINNSECFIKHTHTTHAEQQYYKSIKTNIYCVGH